eukprot:2480899-Alexandrium_andersonii.AAC.1
MPSAMGGGGGKTGGPAGSPPSGLVLKTVRRASAPRPATWNRGWPDRQFRLRHAATVRWSHGIAVSRAMEAAIT